MSKEEYLRAAPTTKDYWNVSVDSTDEQVRQDARSHPVFELRAR